MLQYVLEHGHSPFSRLPAIKNEEEQQGPGKGPSIIGDTRRGKDQTEGLQGKRSTSGSRVEAGPSVAAKAMAGTRGMQWPMLS
jgi:hypothetical protein